MKLKRTIGRSCRNLKAASLALKHSQTRYVYLYMNTFEQPEGAHRECHAGFE